MKLPNISQVNIFPLVTYAIFISFGKNAYSKFAYDTNGIYVICLATVGLCVFRAYGCGCTHFLLWKEKKMKKTTKKIISIILAMILAISFAACSKNASDSAGKAEPTEQSKQAEATLKIDEKAASDIVEITVHKAVLAYEACGPEKTTDGKNQIVNTAEAYLPNGSYSFFEANKGRSLVCLEYTLKNTDRGELDTDDGKITFSVSQNGNSSPIYGYDLNDPDGNTFSMPDLQWSMYSTDGGSNYYKQESMNMLISAGESYRIRVVGIARFEPDLSAPFTLTAELQNSSGETEEFVYEITP